MTYRLPFATLALISALGVGCIDSVPDTSPAAARSYEIKVVPTWDRATGGVDVLFPVTTHHLHTAFTDAPLGGTYAIGTGGGAVLWAFKVAPNDVPAFLEVLGKAWRERETPGSDFSNSSQGWIKGDPNPPGPGGNPELSSRYVELVLTYGNKAEQETAEFLDAISEF